MNTLEVKSIKAADFKTILAKSKDPAIGNISDAQIKALETAKYAYSVFIGGKVLVCAGITEYWEGRGEAWAIFDPEWKHNLKSLHKTVLRFLDICPLRRIEAAVDCDFAPGHRWVKALGFHLEASRLRGFLPDGKDAALYSRVKQ